MFKLSGAGITKDIALSAGLAGLMMLRASSVDLLKIPPGTAILGAVPDEKANTLVHFVFSFAASNGLNPKEMDLAGMSADDKRYLPELTRFEEPFYKICEKNGIQQELFPFTAAASAGKLVLAGNQMKLLNPKVGMALLVFHIAAGSKTVPYHTPNPPAQQA